MTSWLASSDLTRTSIQLASNVRWEEALSVDLTCAVALSEWLKVSGADVAIESIYHDGKGNFKGFFGFRRQLEDVGKRISFWQDVVAQSLKFDTKPPGDQLAAWLLLLGQP